MGRILAFIPLAIAAIFGGFFLWGLNPDRDPNNIPSVLISQPAPEFDLAAVDGLETPGLSRADLVGNPRPVIVNVFASWCVPCRAENPLMVELADTGEVPIYGINYKDAADEAQAFLDELGNPFTRIGADRDGRVAIDWGVYGVPETYVIDAEGRIAHKHVGPFNRQILDTEILPLVRRLQEEGAQ